MGEIKLDESPLPRLARRSSDSHKGDYGRALIIGGSLGMAGAVSLTGMATLRSGAGLVKLAVPENILATVAGFEPSYMTLALPVNSDGQLARVALQVILEVARDATVVACGPGLGRYPELAEFVGWLYTHLECPLVLDADGLNALAAQPTAMEKPAGPRILTPHPGEFSRLVGGAEVPRGERKQRVLELAKRAKAVVVLKGHRSVISDGKRVVVNSTGNAGMATGGTGDVLTGIITALICQKLSPYDAARLGAYVHGLAGDMAARKLGQVSLIARDLISFLPAAFLRLKAEPSS